MSFPISLTSSCTDPTNEEFSFEDCHVDPESNNNCDFFLCNDDGNCGYNASYKYYRY